MIVTEKNNREFNVRRITQIGLLSAIAVILMLFELPLFFAPSFYKIDLSELPVIIGALSMGPLAGAMIELIKIVINLFINGTDTAGIGEIANFLIGCSFVIPCAFIYQRKKTRRNAVIGLIVGVMAITITGSLINAYVLLPAYAAAFKMPIENLVALGTAVNSGINSLSTFILFAVAPFNFIKGTVISVITMLIYKKISIILHS